jgi:cytochrome P450
MAVTPATSPHTSSAKTWPGYRGHWLRGCLREIQNAPLELYPAIRRQCGDFACARALPGFPFYVLFHPDAVEHVLQKNAKNYRKTDTLLKPMRLLVGNGLFTSEGDFWLRQRRLMQPAFNRQHLVGLTERMSAATEIMLREWQTKEAGRTLDIAEEMTRLTLRIASTTLFSTDVSGDSSDIGQAFRATFEYVSRRMSARLMLPLWVPTPGNRRFRRAKRLLDDVVLKIIEGRRKSGAGMGDLLDLLLAAQDEESGGGMTDQQLKDEVLTLLTAGHETAAAALSWSWHLLSQHPEVQNALFDEARGRLQGRLPTPEDVAHLPLARAVFEEAMRLYPPAWGLPRETIGPDEIAGHPLPAKAMVILVQWVTHRHPDFWDEPERFKPERFLAENAAGRAKFAYFPFGGGPRVCIGNTFALTEGTLVLAAVAQHYRVEPEPGHAVIPDPTFTLRPKNGVVVRVSRR